MSAALREERLTELFDVSLTPSEAEAVKAIARQHKVPRSRVIRVAVQRMLEEMDDPTPPKKQKKGKK